MKVQFKAFLILSTLTLIYYPWCSPDVVLAQRYSSSFCERYARDFADRHARSGFFQGGARGAAGGAAIGAIVDGGRGAGTGAAIGSVVGIIGGSARRANDYDSLFRQAYDDCMRGNLLR